MCFQRKTIINQTGLGDEQYDALSTNQGNMGTQIEEGFVATGGKLDTVNDSISGLSTDISTTGNAINAATNAGFTSLNDYLANQFRTSKNNQSQLAQNQMTGFTDLNALNQDRFNSLQGDVSGVQTSVDTGFSDTTTANQNIQAAVDTGFSDQVQGFADTQGLMTDNTADIRGDITSNFDATNKSLGDAQTNIQGDIAASQREVLDGQGGLSSSLTDMSDTNDTYFGSLSDGQGDLQAGLDGFRTTFDTYVDRYSDDTTLANQTRADLQKAQATGFDATRQSIGTLGDTVSQGQNAIINQNKVLGNTIEGGFADNRTGQTSLARTFMNESGEIDTALVNQTRDLAGLAATQTDLDMEVRQNFQQIYNAFDDQGMLIENSIDANGNNIMREMDDNGFLMLRAMDAQGNDLGSKVIDVNDSVRRLQGLTRQQGANMQMGQLSPASQMIAPVDGFASPFTTTR